MGLFIPFGDAEENRFQFDVSKFNAMQASTHTPPHPLSRDTNVA